MSDKFSFKFQRIGNQFIDLEIVLQDDEFLGKSAKLKILRKVVVKDHSPVNSEELLFETNVVFEQLVVTVRIPAENMQAFSYEGKKIDIEIHLNLKFNDGYIFDTKVKSKVELEIGTKPEVLKTEALINPKDLFNFKKNFQAIPVDSKISVLILVFLALILITINTVIGAHDQMVPESQTYFYSHRQSDGDSQSPLMNSLQGSGMIGFIIWLGIRANLRRYMKLHFYNLPSKIKPGDKIIARQIIEGVSRVDLSNALVRVVACNYEKGKYVRGSGTKKRTIQFSNPVQGVVLFEHRYAKLPAKMEINLLLNDVIKFSRMFNTLYPFQMNGKSHGLQVYWELQLIHDDFVDQEVVGPLIFDYHDFMNSQVPEELDQKITDQLFKNV